MKLIALIKFRISPNLNACAHQQQFNDVATGGENRNGMDTKKKTMQISLTIYIIEFRVAIFIHFE